MDELGPQTPDLSSKKAWEWFAPNPAGDGSIISGVPIALTAAGIAYLATLMAGSNYIGVINGGATTNRKLMIQYGSVGTRAITAGEQDWDDQLAGNFPGGFLFGWSWPNWVGGSWDYIWRASNLYVTGGNIHTQVHTHSGINQNISYNWAAIGYS